VAGLKYGRTAGCGAERKQAENVAREDRIVGFSWVVEDAISKSIPRCTFEHLLCAMNKMEVQKRELMVDVNRSTKMLANPKAVISMQESTTRQNATGRHQVGISASFSCLLGASAYVVVLIRMFGLPPVLTQPMGG
jgi:hypothetical protein